MFTIGHGTRTTEELAGLLRAAGAARVIDVRRYPASRRHPHFSRQELERSLPALGVAYEWRGEELGGRRTRRDSDGAGPGPGPGPTRHPAWRNASFGAYADHMDSPAFRDALEELFGNAAEEEPAAIMCAETLWWRCHRRLIADALVVAGCEVVHILDERTRQRHELHPNARVDEHGRPVYDVGVQRALLDRTPETVRSSGTTPPKR